MKLVDLVHKNRLSLMEWQVLDCLRRGLRRKEVAHELHMATITVATHLQRIYRKMGVRDRLELHQLVGFASGDKRAIGRKRK
jgi:DNA-binding NarL/FixJ family response regulator